MEIFSNNKTRGLDYNLLVVLALMRTSQKDTKAEINMEIPSTSNTAPSSLTVLAEVAQSHSSQSSLPDLIGEQNGGADCLCKDDEEMPPLEGDNATELCILKETEN